MFTGLIEEVGECLSLRSIAQGTQLTISAPKIAPEVQLGDSVSINGCCLTVTSFQANEMTFDLLEETLSLTNLRHLGPGQRVNLERALRVADRFGGHFVQGHVDCTTTLIARDNRDSESMLEFALPAKFASLVVYKGSIALNGVSLTVAELKDSSFRVWIIPHTLAHTNLDKLEVGHEVNLEFDILGKYAERILRHATA